MDGYRVGVRNEWHRKQVSLQGASLGLWPLKVKRVGVCTIEMAQGKGTGCSSWATGVHLWNSWNPCKREVGEVTP